MEAAFGIGAFVVMFVLWVVMPKFITKGSEERE